MSIADLELETTPEEAYIRGPRKIKIPETIYEHGKLIGWKWKEVNTVKFVKGLPTYNPFASAEGYYFDCEEWDKIISFIVNECCYPEAENTGLPFIPETWQSCIYANLFCWKQTGTDCHNMESASSIRSARSKITAHENKERLQHLVR